MEVSAEFNTRRAMGSHHQSLNIRMVFGCQQLKWTSKFKTWSKPSHSLTVSNLPKVNLVCTKIGTKHGVKFCSRVLANVLKNFSCICKIRYTLCYLHYSRREKLQTALHSLTAFFYSSTYAPKIHVLDYFRC
jgi:hypothetical protein